MSSQATRNKEVEIMRFNEIAAKIKKRGFRTVVVTGPQRSGTRITAKSFAEELNFFYVDEWEFRNHNEEDFKRIINENKGVVVHAPAMSHICHQLKDDVVVVFSMRNNEDIIKSENRAGWTDEHKEKDRYKKFKNIDLTKPISHVKYSVFIEYQFPKIKHCFPCLYSSLKETEYWINKEDRLKFKIDQTKI